MKEAYHYTESGLDNVYLYNISVVQDIKGEKVIYVPKINQLHKVIAEGIIYKKGLISVQEIKFLRTEMGLKQSELSGLLGKEAQAVGRWERGDNSIDKTTDTLLRLLVAQYLNLEINPKHISELVAIKAANDNINIDGTDNNYKLMVA
ncbi:MAG: helix-turn-helix domain-containing protein [Alphaproteobacteria bacterium]|nr:helix-turn-helix domain-containing protein [Alphaproteobacteria bacterium]